MRLAFFLTKRVFYRISRLRINKHTKHNKPTYKTFNTPIKPLISYFLFLLQDLMQIDSLR